MQNARERGLARRGQRQLVDLEKGRTVALDGFSYGHGDGDLTADGRSPAGREVGLTAECERCCKPWRRSEKSPVRQPRAAPRVRERQFRRAHPPGRRSRRSVVARNGPFRCHSCDAFVAGKHYASSLVHARAANERATNRASRHFQDSARNHLDPQDVDLDERPDRPRRHPAAEKPR